MATEILQVRTVALGQWLSTFIYAGITAFGFPRPGSQSAVRFAAKI
jgi:hypothetical protein